MSMSMWLLMTLSNTLATVTAWTNLIWSKIWMNDWGLNYSFPHFPSWPTHWFIEFLELNATGSIRMTFRVSTDWINNITDPVVVNGPDCTIVRQYRWVTEIANWWLANAWNWFNYNQAFDISPDVEIWDIFKWEFWAYIGESFWDYRANWGNISTVNIYSDEWSSWAITIL